MKKILVTTGIITASILAAELIFYFIVKNKISTTKEKGTKPVDVKIN